MSLCSKMISEFDDFNGIHVCGCSYLARLSRTQLTTH